MRYIFLAFPSYQVSISPKVKKIGNIEFWNLEKIKEDEFINLVQKKIRPINKNVRKNYFITSSKEAYQKAYAESSWGMLLPDLNKDNLGGRYESLFTVNLFSSFSLPLMFYASRMGIMVEHKALSVGEKMRFHKEDKKFIKKQFIKFYNLLLPEIIGTDWQAYEVFSWSREDWRLSIACSLFMNLSKYQKGKYPMRWQEECADIVTFYETLLSRQKDDTGKYKIIQRIEVLLGDYYKNDLHKIRKDLSDLYSYRNEFVHGSFFDRLKRDTRSYQDNSQMAQMPNIDFRFLEKQEEIAKQVFVSFLYVRKKFKNTGSSALRRQTIPEIINTAIMDVRLRKKIQFYTREVLNLL